MANNYLSFSEAIAEITPEEKAWLDGIPDRGDYEDNPDYADEKAWLEAFKAALEAYGIDCPEVKDTLDMFPYFEWKIDERGSWWMYTDESAFLDHVVCMVQAFIRKFRPDLIFKLTWCEYCDKPRLGEFGGGWIVVSKDEAEYGNTWQQADEIAEALKTGSFKA